MMERSDRCESRPTTAMDEGVALRGSLEIDPPKVEDDGISPQFGAQRTR